MTTEQSEGLERQVRIAARPETIFAFFVDPQKMLQWKGIEAELDPRPGGIYRVNVTGKDIARSEYVEIVPYTRVVFTGAGKAQPTQCPLGAALWRSPSLRTAMAL